MGSKLLTTTEAAKAVGISRASLQEWIRIGRARAPEVQLRGGHAVRLWSEADLKRLRETKKQSKIGRPRKKS